MPVEVGGERVVMRAELSPTWHRFRICTCAAQPLWCGPFGLPFVPLFALCYALCCGWARRREASSWQLLMTPSTLYFKHMLYDWWCCGYQTRSLAIPLHRITDIKLTRGCCDEQGLCSCLQCSCGFEDASAAPWKLLVYTSKMSSPTEASPELVIHCARDPAGIKRQVFDARAAFLRLADARPAPAAKGPVAAGGSPAAPPPDARSACADPGAHLVRPGASRSVGGSEAGDASVEVLVI